jgi:hypothetical protein
METLGLFDQPTARLTDPDTSHLAAEKAAKGAESLRFRCHRALIQAGANGLTDFELAEQVESQQTSAGKRRGELVEARLVRFAGFTRPAPSGSAARVWVAA